MTTPSSDAPAKHRTGSAGEAGPDRPTAGPHRYPFRFIDTASDLRAAAAGRDGDPSVEGAGSSAADRPPSTGLSAGAVLQAVGRAGQQTLPGGHPLSLLVEIMAQGALAALANPASPAPDGASLRLAGVDDAVLHRSVGPGDRLTVEARVEGRFGGMAKVACRLFRDGGDDEPVAEARLLLAGAPTGA